MNGPESRCRFSLCSGMELHHPIMSKLWDIGGRTKRKRKKGKLPLFRGNGERVNPIYGEGDVRNILTIRVKTGKSYGKIVSARAYNKSRLPILWPTDGKKL